LARALGKERTLQLYQLRVRVVLLRTGAGKEEWKLPEEKGIH